MGELSKQYAMYISLLFCCTPYTMIATFFPNISKSSGVPIWSIGLIFSADPMAALLTSMCLGKFMIRLGRKSSILLGLLLCALSMFFLCPVESVDRETLIVLSLLSRIFAGTAAACIMTASDSIVVSDYPDRIDTMIGRLEGAIGIGLIIGPLIGVVLYTTSLFFALLAFGVLILAFIPVCSKMIGKLREYSVENNDMSSFTLLIKPKITLDLGMNFLLLFAFGFIEPTLELHLISFGMNSVWISVCFLLHSASYAFFAFTGSWIFKRLDSRTVLCIGLGLMSVGFLILAPWQVFLPRSLWLVLCSLPILGMGQALIYIPTFPHMVQVASQDYGFCKDDMLSDSLSSVSNMSCNLGEILGPIVTGFIVNLFGFEMASTSMSFTCFGYLIIYLIGSGLACKTFRSSDKEVGEKINFSLKTRMVSCESFSLSGST